MHGRVTVLLVAAAVMLLASSAVAQPWPSCNGASGNYTAGSAYANNTLQLILGLQTNASASPAYFASGSVGAGAGAVHGLMICRGDVSSNDCFDCGTRAWQDVQAVQPLCNRTRDAALADNQCYVRVAATDFLASPNNTGLVSVVGGASIPSGVDVAAYDTALRRLLNATAQHAVDSSVPSSPPRLYFATGQFVGLDPRVPNIWSLAQCAGDLAPAQCRRCLDDLMTLWWNGSGFKPDGESATFAGSRCNLKSDLGDKFYTSSPMVKLQMNSEVVVPAPAPSAAGKNNSSGKLLGIILPIMFVVVVIAIALFVCKKRKYRGIKLPHGTHMVEDFESIKSTLLSLSSLQVATSNFDENNKLGEGGFGVVYKGDLSGQQVAVKRLSKGSGQGLEELKNELVLVAKLHHKNLVRLEGFCLEEGERLLVYEYMPNKSLDTILFDPEEKIRLDWRKRFNIIEGVARGLQYLHEESQKKIIHRDMKASNVLLDEDMNPKIGDFGLARLFGQDQTRDVTKHIVGTFGYMSPEYVMRGQFSTKSDVFSFGILVIEIITGRRNIGHYFFDEQNEDIISLVWRHWTEGTIVEMIDDSLGRNYSESEVLKCVNIGLLCLQHSPMDRPTMSDVMVMLNGDDTSSIPSAARPTFFLDRSTPYSYNSCTITHMSPR